MNLPQKYIHKAIISKLKTLGYVVDGLNYPRVEVYGFMTTPSGEKINKEWEVTFIIEAIDSANSPTRAMDMIENIRTNITESITVSNFSVLNVIWEQLEHFEEITENDYYIQRQIQRARFTVTEN